MEIALKPGAIADLDVLTQMMQKLYEHEQLPFDHHAARTALAPLLQNTLLGRVWLICRNSEAIGYVVLTLGYSLEYGGQDAFIDELYIQERWRGRGMGTQTLQQLESACYDLGVQALHLEAERKNIAAQAFYRKVGFVDHDRVLMTKWIAASQATAQP